MRLWLMERALSVDHRRPGYVVRHARVTVDYFDKDGEASGKTQKGATRLSLSNMKLTISNGIMFWSD